MNNKALLYHILLPIAMPVLFFINAAIPVSVFGCRNRGLIAFAIALLSGLAGLVTVITALRERLRGNPKHYWWIISTLILIVPIVALIILA